jgi:peptidoglycan/xylan/chitin deacetylase (PgdA/CDA1 family)
MKRLAKPAGVLVLMYHEVRRVPKSEERPYIISPASFTAHIRALRAAGYLPCSLGDFSAWATGRGKLSSNAVLLTFDDGYRGVFEHAYPLLHSEALPFAVFIVSSALGATDSWLRDIQRKHPGYPLMSGAHLIELARAGVGIGSHSRTHANLAMLDSETLREEVYGSRAELEDLLGQRIDCFAYPYGRLNDRVRDTVSEAGYACAFSTRSGSNHPGSDPLLVRRIDVYGTDTANALLRKLRFRTNDGSMRAAGLYYVRRALARLMARLGDTSSG